MCFSEHIVHCVGLYRILLRVIYSTGVTNSNITIYKTWLAMHASEVATWRADTSFRRQTTVVHFSLLVLSFTILHVFCQNSRWSKPQAVHCLCQLTYLAVLVPNSCSLWHQHLSILKLQASSQVETYSICNSIMILWFLFLQWTRNASISMSIWNLVSPP